MAEARDDGAAKIKLKKNFICWCLAELERSRLDELKGIFQTDQSGERPKLELRSQTPPRAQAFISGITEACVE